MCILRNQGGSEPPLARPTRLGKTPGWGSPGWKPARRSRFVAWLTWPFRLADHDPACRWRRFVQAVNRVTWRGWST